MNILKGFALGILGLLLFISLTLLGIAITINQTLLNPDFVTAQIQKLDTSSLIKSALQGEILGQIPPEFQFLTPVVDKTLNDITPFLKEEVNKNVYVIYDYMMGKSQNFNIELSLEKVKTTLRDNAWEAIQKSPPPEFSQIPPAMMEQLFNQYYQQFSGMLPSTLKFDQTSVPPESASMINQVRQWLGYFQTIYMASIGFSVLVILLIILIDRRVKSFTRGIGSTLITVGVLSLAEFFLLSRLLLPQMLPQVMPPDMPAQLQTWVSNLFTDVLTPLQIYGIGLLAAGIVLVVISIVYRPKDVEISQ